MYHQKTLIGVKGRIQTRLNDDTKNKLVLNEETCVILFSILWHKMMHKRTISIILEEGSLNIKIEKA